MTSSVLVVGGGITGLAAAHELVNAGIPVTLVESDERLGGKVRTDVVDGFLVEVGPDSFVSYRPAAQQLAVELGLAQDLISPNEPRTVYLRRDGKMVPLPDGMGLVLPTRLGPFARTRLFSWPQKLRAGMDLALPRQLGTEDVAVGAFLRHRLGDAVVTRLADPLIGGIYGTSLDELSLDTALPQLRDFERENRSLVVASLAQGRAARAAQTQQSDPAASPFRTPRAGMGSLVDALVARLSRAPGVDLRVGVGVTALQPTGATTLARMSDGSQVRADAVVIAAPAATAAALVGPEIPRAAALIESVRSGSTAVVSLGYTEDSIASPPLGHGFLEAGPHKAVFSGCTFTSRKWPGRAASGTLLLRVFLPDRSAALLARTDAEVFRTVEAALTPAIGATKPAVMRHLARWPRAMPVYSVGHLDRMALLASAMRQRPGWALAGSTYGAGGVPGCVASGRQAAADVLRYVSAEAEEPETAEWEAP